jgi:hypothetical protein
MIPISTTTITVLSPPTVDLDAEPYSGNDDTNLVPTATGVRAVIDRGRGREVVAGGEQAIWDAELTCDETPIQRTDSVKDEQTGLVYRVVWVLPLRGYHVEAGLRIVQGDI